MDVYLGVDDTDSVKDLERLYNTVEEWQELVEFLEGRADRARDLGNTEEELSFLTKVGDIWDKRLEDSDRAKDIYERVLEQEPENTGALAALARLYEATADWERCAEVLNKAAATGGGGKDGAEVHYRLARLQASHLGDEDKAFEELKTAIELDPEHAEANQALAEQCRNRGDNQGLVDALIREESYITASKDKVAKLLEIAELLMDGMGESARAIESLEKAKELDNGSTDVLLKLSNAYIDGDRQDDAIPVIEALIDAETNGGKKRSRKAAVYHHTLAKAYLSRGDKDKGITHLEAAYKMDISNLDVLVSLGKLHYEAEDFDKSLKLFRALLLQRFDNIAGLTKADIYWYVGDIFLKQDDKRKAKGMFQRGLDEKSDHDGCKVGLEACK